MAATQILTLIMLVLVAATLSTVKGSKEVCQWETFEAKCQDDEVILMKAAHYGRMRVGRCNPRNYFIGCSADVTAIMHARCSGKSYCSVPIPDSDMFTAQPCPIDLVAYLEADYECVKVAQSNAQDCEDQVLTELSGYIAKPKTVSHNKRHVCPHRIMALPGQTINVYLFDFVSQSEARRASSRCISYGQVSENRNTPTKICGGAFRENHLIYSSDTNVVDIRLTERASHPHAYLLEYKVVGCPKIQPPKDSWVQVKGKTAIVTCNKSNMAVSLVCAGNKWLGELQNCTNIRELPASGPVSGATLGDFANNTGLLLVLSVGLSLGVLFGVGLLVVAIYIRARRNKEQQVADATLQATTLLSQAGIRHGEMTLDKTINVDYGQLPGNQYQPVYVPVTLPICPKTPLSAVTSPRVLSFGDYSTAAEVLFSSTQSTPGSSDVALLSDTPTSATESNYGFIGSLPNRECGHTIYDLAALTRTLSKDNVIEVDETES